MSKVRGSVKPILIVVGLVVVIGGFFLVTMLTQKADDSTQTDSVSQTTDGTPGQIETSGSFIGLDDHEVTGSYSIIENENNTSISFDESFKSQSGPDLFVYLSKNDVSSGEELGEFVSVGELQSFEGAQTYSLPEGTDLSQYKSVVIWCEEFSVLFGAAPLN